LSTYGVSLAHESFYNNIGVIFIQSPDLINQLQSIIESTLVLVNSNFLIYTITIIKGININFAY